MRTRVSHKPGPSTSTPSSTGTPVGKEVQGPVPADNAAAQAATPVAAPGALSVATPDPGAVAAAKAFREALQAAWEAFSQHLRTLPPGTGRRGAKPSTRRLAATPLIVGLLREFPDLAPRSDPDVIDAEIADANAMQLVVLDLQAKSKLVADTVRLDRVDAWYLASAGYSAGLHLAKTDRAVMVKVAPIRDALKRGPRLDTAPLTTASATTVAAKAQTRAARAQLRVQAASQSHARAVQANAARHPVVGTPVPASVSQGPAVTTPADAASNQGPAVNPQGPAPGR